MKKILVPLADGFEEIEAVTIIDVLRRAGGEVVTAGLEKRNVHGSHQIHLVADTVLAECLDQNWDLIVLPGGGEGVKRLLQDSRLKELLQRHKAAGKLTGAICAAPAVLANAGVLQGRKVTGHPTWREAIIDAQYSGAAVEDAEKIVTGRSAGAALKFAYLLVEKLFGPEKVREIDQGIIAEN